MKCKTTVADFEYFKLRCEYWVDFWGLKDIHVLYSHVKDDGTAIAWVNRKNINNAAVRICLEKEPGMKIDKNELELVAFHEVCHVVLARYNHIAECREMTLSELNAEEEYLVRRLENCVFPVARHKM